MATFIPNITDVFPKPALFDVDWNFVDKALQRKSDMFESGVAKAKSAFDAILYAPLSDKANLPIRDEYVRQAREKLKSLSGADFSLPETINSAQQIFSPFWNDKFIVQDTNYTKWYQKQNQILQTWKNSPDEKVREKYNGIASMYLSNGLQTLVDANRSEDAYGKIQKREATPFTNLEKYLEEMAGKDPDKLKVVWDNQSPDGAYLVSSINGERSKKSFANWAQAMLGNNFFEQFRVTGVVEREERVKNYRKMDPNLTDDQINDLISKDAVKELRQGYEKRQSNADVELAEINSILKNLPKTLNPQQQEYVKVLNDQIAALNGRKTAIDEEYKYFNTNDAAKIQEFARLNPDMYFATLAKQRTVDNWATGRAGIESKKVAENGAWFKAQELALNTKKYELDALRLQYDREKAIYEMSQGKEGKEGKKGTGTKTGTTGTGTDTGTTDETEVSGMKYLGAGTADITQNAKVASEVFQKTQFELIDGAHSLIFDPDGALLFAKKGLGMSDQDIAYVTTALRKEMASIFHPELPDYDFTKEEAEASDKLIKLLKDNQAVKDAGIKVEGPQGLRNALIAYSSDYVGKQLANSDAAQTGGFPYDEREFGAFLRYTTALTNLNAYNANEQNRQELINKYASYEGNKKDAERFFTKDKDGNYRFITSNELANDPNFKAIGGKWIAETEIELKSSILNPLGLNARSVGPATQLTAQKIAEAFIKGDAKFSVQTVSKFDDSNFFNFGTKKENLSMASLKINGENYTISGLSPEERYQMTTAVQNILDKYGKSEDFTTDYTRIYNSIIPDLQFYKTQTGKMGADFIGLFDKKKTGDDTAMMFIEAMQPSNGTLYRRGVDGLTLEPLAPNEQAVLRSVIGEKEANIEKLVQAFTYHTSNINGKKSISFSISPVSGADKDQLGMTGVNLKDLEAQSFEIELSDNAQAPTLSQLPYQVGMQVNNILYRGKAITSDPMLKAAGFDFSITPATTDNPDKVMLSLKYKRSENVKNPQTGVLELKTTDVVDERSIPLKGPNAKTADEIVNYMYTLFQEMMVSNKNARQQYDAYIKANSSSVQTVDKEAFFKSLGINIK
jgi:hypothetical protein